MMVIRNAFWLSVCRFAADFSSLVLFTVLSRDLGPASTGEYSYAFALGAFIAILAASGLDQYGVRQYVRLGSDADRATCWRNMLVVQLLQLFLGLGVLGLAAAFLGGRNADPRVIVELTIFLVGWGLSRTFFIPAIARQAMATPAFTELGCRAAASLSAMVLLLSGVHSMPVLLLPFPIAGALLIALALRNAVRNGAPLRLGTDWKEIAAIARGTLPFTLCEALGQFYIRADLLVIVHLLGTATVGWYAADLKMVEVGVMPLILLGTAAYPVLSRTAVQDRAGFVKLAEEYLRGVLFLSGWLAVGLYCLVPLVIDLLFGDRFDPATRMLPLFAVLAITKGLEIGVYRLLYAARRQNIHLAALAVGATLILLLNFWLIPAFGADGAIAVVVISTALVDLICITGLKNELPTSLFVLALARLMLPLACAALVFTSLRSLALNEWIVALGSCLAFPVLGIVSGLLPHPRRSFLLATERAPTPM
ncbi:MAG: oligosaccharide flippase family protein [Proteobacteria bacterium]|nr:oligosaccharide flippase family protein [Pseudomonadota bacterium]